jgi:hypothetical protein
MVMKQISNCEIKIFKFPALFQKIFSKHDVKSNIRYSEHLNTGTLVLTNLSINEETMKEI